MLIIMQDKMKQMEDKEITLKADNDKLKSEIEVCVIVHPWDGFCLMDAGCLL